MNSTDFSPENQYFKTENNQYPLPLADISLSPYSNNEVGNGYSLLASSNYEEETLLSELGSVELSIQNSPLTDSIFQKLDSSPQIQASNFNGDELTGFNNFTTANSLALSSSINNIFSVIAEGRVTINGRSDFDGLPLDLTDDALIYAGLGFTINGNQTLPVQRDENGNPLIDDNNKQILVENAVAVSDQHQHLNANAVSNTYSGLIPPSIVESQTVEIPEYNQLIQERLNLYENQNTTEIEFDIRNNRMNNLNQWNSKFPAPGTPENPTVVRVIGGGLNIPSRVELDNYIITVEQGDINFNGSNHQLNNVTLITENGNMNLSRVQAINSAIFAQRTINMNSGARFGGDSLIANENGNITFNGGTITVEETDNLRVISAGNITFNGATDTRGQFLASNNFTFNGSSTLYGSIEAKNNITFNGRAEVIGISAPESPPEISIDDITVIEGDTEIQIAQFTVSLSQPSSQSVYVNYATADGSAIAGEDYRVNSGTLEFLSGETIKFISVPIIADNVDELNENFLINLNNSNQGIIIDNQGVSTIIDNDNPPELSINDITVTETDSGVINGEITVSLSAVSGKTITVDYSSQEDTAIAGLDYQSISGSLTFNPGEITKTIIIPILGDSLDEIDEKLSINLSNENNATISDGEAIVTIIDNDNPPELSINDITVTETDSGVINGEITVSLSAESGKTITVDYSSQEDTATEGIDYQGISGSLTFNPGETSKTIVVEIIGDSLDEIDEKFSVNLTNPVNVTVVDNQSVVTIIDNDNPPELSIDDITVTETDSGVINGEITVSLSSASGKTISVDYSSNEDTATEGIDYQAISGSLTFNPGEITKTIIISILGDSLDEIDEKLSINLSNENNATISDGYGIVTIIDNDSPPQLTINDISVIETDDGVINGEITVSLSAESRKTIAVDYDSNEDTAIAGLDYQSISGSLTFNPGETSKTIVVEIIGDSLDEIDEKLSINLTNPVNVTIVDNQSVVTIIDNDNPPELSIDDITVTETDSGVINGEITVSLSAESGKTISVDYDSNEDTATEGIDYQPISGSLTFNPGEITKTILVEIIGDSLDEIDEKFSVNLTNPVNVNVVDNQSVVTIIDNDNPPELSINDISVIETDSGVINGEITVSLSAESGKTITVDYDSQEDTATEGIDYQPISGSLTFNPGETSKTIVVEIIGDSLDEIDEKFSVNLTNPVNVTVVDNQSVVTIIDNDNPPELIINDITVTETDSGVINGEITVSLSAESGKTITVDYDSQEDTATEGIDYQGISGSLTFNPGETSKTIVVEIIGDSLDEIDEKFSVNLSNANNASINDGEGIVTIIDNDNPPELSINDITVTETDDGVINGEITVSLSAESGKTITVDYSSGEDTALAGIDYQPISGSLTFNPGETSKTIVVEIIGDSLDEIDEKFSVNLTNPVNVTVVDNQSVVTIIDNDNPPELIINDISVIETDDGVINGEITVSLSAESGKTISVDYDSNEDTATEGIDYQPISGSLTFNPGEIEKTIIIPILGDSLDEIDEELSVNLSNANNASINDGYGIVTIIDDDNPPELTVNDITVTETDEGIINGEITVFLSSTSGKTITVDYDSSDDTATEGIDYQPISGSLTFNPGETSKTIVVEIIGDSLDEINEKFNVNLSNENNVSINDGYGIVTIIDNDNPPEITIANTTVTEGDGVINKAIFTASLSQVSSLPISVDFQTADGTAISPEDYQASNGTITFNPGETVKTIEVSVVGDDLNEADETFTLQLTNASNGIISQSEAIATIIDDDEPPSITINDVSVNENDQGISVATFTVSLSEAISDTVTVEFATAENEAVSPEDYIAKSGSLTFNPTEIEKTIEIEIIGDTVDEVDETFKINLTNPTNAIIDDSEGQGTILDDDQIVNVPEGILLEENDLFHVEYIQPITIPATSSLVTITYSQLNFDTNDTDSINDAFEIALVDENGQSLVLTIGSQQDAFFNITEEELPNLASGVSLSAETITLNLTDIPSEVTGDLIFRLVNNDSDVNTSVRINEVEIDSGNGINPVDINDGKIAIANSNNSLNFDSLVDVSDSINPQYQQTSFNEKTNILTTQVALANEGTYYIDNPLIVAIKNISDFNVQVLNKDGVTPDGLPYYDFSDSIDLAKLAPTQISQAQEISFYNPNKTQFTYELVVLSGLNYAPEIISQPDIEIIGGQTYNYQVMAEDRNGDTLSYELLVSPSAMTINEETGVINWETTTEDIANHAIVVKASDGRGGIDLQTYNLAVINTPPNRPPNFTSTPVVDAYINQLYSYDADAIDADNDPLNFEVIIGPDGLIVNPNTGLVEWTPPAVVVLGDTVIGQISILGERDEFTFSGSIGQHIYFDPLQYTGNQNNWSFGVYSPNGTRVVDSNLYYSNNQLIQLPETGNYRIVVDPSYSTTGSYGFSVIDVALTPLIPFDTVIEGQLSPGSEDDVYRFIGSKGQRLFIDEISNGSNLDWVLYNERNEVVTSNYSMNDMEVVLPIQGEYRLAIRGQANFTTTVNYAFEIITPDEIIAPMELGNIDTPNSVFADITEKGERDVYTFEGTTGQSIYFDRLFLNSTNNSSHTISLTDPRGVSIWSRNFNQNDDTVPILLSQDGTYTVKIDASGENTGTYSFNLLDFNQATEISLDTQYTNSFNPGQETHIYQFDSIQGQRLFIDSIQSTGGYWRLYNSNLQEIKNTYNSDMELVISKSDTYYLVIQGNNNNPVNYQFEVITPDEVTAPMNLGNIDIPNTVSADITEKGERDVYTFEGTIGQSIYFDHLALNSTNNSSHTISLSDPRGVSVWSRNFSSNDDTVPILLSQDGTYTVKIDASGENTGTYSFNLLDFNQATLIDFDVAYFNTLNPSEEAHLYQFNGIQGKKLYLDTAGGTSGAYWMLYDTANNKIRDLDLNSDAELVLSNTGTYTLAVRGLYNNASVNYTFSVIDSDMVTQELTFNQAIVGEIGEKGEQDVYTFTGVEGQKLFLDTLVDNANIKVTLIDSHGGKILNGVSLAGDDTHNPFNLSLTGDYQLIVDGSGEATGEYNFQLYDLSNASELTINSTITDSINPGSEIEVYKLAGYEGYRLYFQSSESNDSIPNWLLYSSGNTKLVDKTLNQDFEHVFLDNQTYYLVIRGDGSLTDTFDYEFEVTNTDANPVSDSLLLNDWHVGTIGEIGQRNVYTFDGIVGQQLYLDGVISDQFTATIYNPNGQQIFNGNLNEDSANFILSEAGTYELVVDGIGNAVGDYNFRLVNLADVDVLPLDIETTGMIAAGESKLYQLDATAGDKLELISQSLATNADWVLYAPGVKTNGSSVVATAGIDSNLTTFLPIEGRYDNLYTLAIRNQSDEEISYGFTANLTEASDVVNSGLGQLISGSYGVGETIEHQFTAQAGTLILLDGMSNSDRIRTALIRPDGTQLFSNHDTRNDTGVYLLEQSGEYTVRVYDYYNNASRSYEFQVLDLTTAPQINLDEVISGDFGTHGRETDLYRFSGQQGQHIFFNRLSGYDYNEWGVYTDTGVRLNWTRLGYPSSSAGDFERSLPYTGEYIIRLNGYGNNNNAYSFELLTNEWSTSEYTIGETISGAEIAINEPGHRDTYTFSGIAGQTLYFDSLEDSNTNIDWKLTDANGRVVFNDDLRDDQFITLTETGDYTLVIDGVGVDYRGYQRYQDVTGSYGFQVFDWEDLSSINLDEIVSGDFGADGRETDLYRFSGQQGQHIFFNRLSGYDYNEWGVYTDTGVRLNWTRLGYPSSSAGDFERSLPYTGEYIIRLNGYGNNNNTYSFELLTNEWSTSEYTIGETISGAEIAINEPGHRDTYTFSGIAGQTLYFDSLEDSNTNIDWKLTDANGRVVFNDDLRDDQFITLTETGDYTLVVDGVGVDYLGYQRYQDVIGSYGFRILDWEDLSSINLDEIVSGDFGADGRETDLYRFSGQQGQHIFFNRLSGYDYNEWGVYTDTGVRLNWTRLGYPNSSAGDFERSLPYTGEYIIRLNGYENNNNTYSFELLTNEWSTSEYTIGETISGAEISINEPGHRDIYNFSAIAGQRLYFDSLEDSNTNIDWKLTDGNGRVIFNDDLRDDQFITLTETGNYTLVIDGVGVDYRGYQQNQDVTGSYGFRVFDWEDLPSINLDEVVSGDFGSYGRETDLYRFSGQEGQHIFFNRLSGYDYNEWGLYTDTGVRLNWTRLGYPGSTAGDFERTLPYTGEYIIRLNGYENNNNTYSFELLTNEWSTSEYTIGETISGAEISINEPGHRHTYTFSAIAGQTLYFDSLEDSDVNIDWKLTDGNGRVVFNDDLRDDQFITLTETGDYTLVIDGVGVDYRGYQQNQDVTGSYGFRVFDWEDLPSINLDEVVSGDFGSYGRETDLYSFVGETGQRLLLDRTIGGYYNNWGLYNSKGKLVTGWNRLSNDFEYTLPTTDNYILRLTGNGNNDNNYSFQVNSSQTLTSSLIFGESIESELSKPGEQDVYVFEGQIGQKLFYDSLDGQSNLKAKFYSPTGKLIVDHDSSRDLNPFTLTETGTYRLVMDGDSTATGSYGFILNDLAEAIALDLATPTIGNLDNGKAINLYQFNGNQGQVFNFNLDAASWNGANWQLYDPGNRTIADPNANNPDFQVALPTNGTYTLAIIGDSVNSINYEFEVTDNTPTSVTQTGLNTTYSGNLSAGEFTDHTFTAKAGTQIFYDSLNNSDWRIRARLINPDGSYVFDNHDSRYDTGVWTLPQTGEYNLQIYGVNTSITGSYGFQLLELPQDNIGNNNQALALNSVTSGTLNPGLESNVYSFFGKPGQQILFNGITGDNVTVSLYAPNGVSVFSRGNYRYQDNGIYSLSQNGIYNLIIRGEQTADRDYSFQMLDFGFGSNFDSNQTVSGSLANGQQSKVYNFTTEAGQRLYFDMISGSTSVRVKVYAPGNHQLLKDTYLHPSYDFELIMPSDGVYTVYLEGGRSSTPVNYSFRTLFTEQNSSVLVPGTGETGSGNDDGSLGLFPVKLKTEDGQGGQDIQEYYIRLLSDPDNASPVIISTPVTKYAENQQAYRYQIDAFDLDNDTLTYRLVDSPLGALIDKDTGELIWFPETVNAGQSYDFTVEVTDGRGGIDQQSFSVDLSETLGKIQGLVFEDLNANGIPDTKLLKGENPDIFFVIDVSGSMGGSSVDWRTADIAEVSQQEISPLDQELGAILALAEFTIAQGRGNETQFGIITSGRSVIDMNPFEEGIQETTTALADNNNNGIIDIREVIDGGFGGGVSNTSGIATAWSLHQALPGDPNIVFMSDGFISVNTHLIADVKADGVNITAFGFAETGMDTMRLVDPDAVYISNPQEMINIFSGFDPRYIAEPLMEGVTVYLDLNDNGVLDEDEPNQVTRRDDSISRLGNNYYTFTFDNLLPGTYIVRQVIPNGFTETTPETGSFVDTVTVDGGESFSYFFGNHKFEPVPNSNPNFTSNVPTDNLEVGDLFKYQATATDIDGDLLSYDLTLAPQGMSVDSETGTVIWTPLDNQVGKVPAILRVNDGEGGADIQYFELFVNPPNNAPVFTSSLPENVAPQVGKPFQYQAVAIDADNDTISYELGSSSPSGVAIAPETGLLTWTPTNSQLGAREITIKANDGKGGEAIQTINLNLIAPQPNQAPEFTSNPRNSVRIGSNYFYQPIAIDPDGDRLTYNLIIAPEGMVIDEAGRIIWSPTASQFGTHNVEIEVTDGQGSSAIQNYNVVASDRSTNNPPAITSTPNTKTNLEKLYTYQATATDNDGDLLLWSLDNAPEGMVIDPTTGAISWQPNNQQIGIHTVAVRVMDALGAFVGQEFNLTVTGINTPPEIVSVPITEGAVNQNYTYQVVANDPENDPLNYSLGNQPSTMTINSSSGLISWTPTTAGKYQIEVIVVDTFGASNTQNYQIEIGTETINQTPVITSIPQFLADINTPYTYQVIANDSDGDELNYQLVVAPDSMTIDEVTGEINWPNPTIGTHQVIVTVDDSQSSVAQGYTLNVKENLAPVINLTVTPEVTATPGETYRYDVKAYDPNGDTLTYSVDTESVNKGISIDEFGRLRWTPEATDVGTHQIVLTVSDEVGDTVEQTFEVNVLADTEAPTVNIQPLGTIYIVDGQFQTDINSRIAFMATATDNAEVTGLQLLVNNTPVEIDNNGVAKIDFTELGTVTIKALAYDAAGNIGQTETTIDVLNFSDVDAPIVELDLTGIETITNAIDIIGTVEDENLDYYVLEVAPTNSDSYRQLFRSETEVDNDIIGKFDPTTLINDAYNLRLRAVDEGGNTASVEKTVYVEGDLKLGNFQLSFTDLTIPVPGIPINVTRTYDTLTANSRDDFGYGWRLEFRDTNLSTSLGRDETYETFDILSKGFQRGDKVFITLPGGERETFTFQPELDRLGGFLISPSGNGGLYHPRFVSQTDSNNVLTVQDTLITLSESGQFVGLAGLLYNPIDPYFGGKYTLTTGEGIVYDIDATTGDLLTVTDTNNNRLTFSESGISSDTGLEVKFGRDAIGRITKVIDPQGNEIVYKYDIHGDLIAVTDRENNTTQFKYNNARPHYLEEIIDPLGRSGVKTEYDENGRLARVIDVNGEAVELIYDTDNSVQTVKDVLGNESTYVYDDRGNVLTEVDSVGKITQRTYDQRNNVLSEKIIADGNEYLTTFTYDERNNVLSETDALGNVTRYSYGRLNRLLTETNALGNTTIYTYDRRGNMLTTTDAMGNVTKFVYATNGNMISTADAVGNLTTFGYDSQGNVTQMVDASGGITKYAYDVNGNQTGETRLVTTANGIEELVTTFEYDENNNLISSVDAENNLTRYEYNGLNQQVAVIDAKNRRTEYRYDEKGQLVETIYPDSTPLDLTDNPRKITVYDVGNRQRATIDEAGRITYYNYDSVGRLVETIYPDEVDTLADFVSFIDETKTEVTIDWTKVVYPDANPDYLIDNPRTLTEYYQDGQTKTNVDERGFRTEYIYDDVNRLIETIYPQLAGDDFNHSDTVVYDAVGRQLSTTDALGRTTEYRYDNNGRVVETIFADGTSVQTVYDELGRMISAIDQEGKVINYEYDNLGRLSAVIQYLNQDSANPTEIKTKYGYDELGRNIWQEDANGNRTSFEYDKLSRRTVVELPEGQTSVTGYDEVGNVISYTDFNGDTITYTYDERNRLIKKAFPDNTKVEYSYTINGLMSSIIQERGVTIYEYDYRDRLISRIDPVGDYLPNGNSIEYSYDLAGNRTSVTTPNNSVDYTFDAWNRLETVTDNDSNVTSYSYDAVNNLVSTILSNGVVETREYDELNRLIFLENKLGDEVISSYRYTLNQVGHRLQVSENDGRIVDYIYDDLYRLVSETITDAGDINDGRVIEYILDTIGNRLSKVDSVEGTTTYTYNQNDWLLTESIDGVTTVYEYDDNGNTIKVIEGDEETLYDWNYENRLISVVLPDGTTISYEYDDEGIKVSEVVNGVSTDYLIDKNRPYAQVLEEYVDGELAVEYVYGNDLISQSRGEELTVYLVDGLGSVRVLTDTNGGVVDVYDYDGFGNLINNPNGVENSYRYAGEQFDDNLSEYYLRQRFYNPNVGRFTRRDTYEGRMYEPITLHKYLYANGDPINYIDPSGELALWQIITAVIMVGITAGMGYYVYNSFQNSGYIPTNKQDGSILMAKNLAASWTNQMASGLWTLNYEKWYNNTGIPDPELRNTVKRNWNRLAIAFKNPIPTKYYPDLTSIGLSSNTVAAAAYGSPVEIFLSEKFFEYDLEDPNKSPYKDKPYTRAGIFIHEMTHEILDTDDIGGDYTVSFALNLAKTKPKDAIRNAQNYMYHTQDTIVSNWS